MNARIARAGSLSDKPPSGLPVEVMVMGVSEKLGKERSICPGPKPHGYADAYKGIGEADCRME